ncbi:DUF58 domain-containing protein [Nocardioides sp.]|uniref:DUF58 domain-containing protein n=1 Tax=Nocardioides sp. TaxID=35761 RepID=UPI0035186245
MSEAIPAAPSRPRRRGRVREGLSGLTLRGRAFLAAGVTAVTCAVVLGQPALARVGVLVMVLPLATVLLLVRARYDLALVRSIGPRVVTAGSTATITLDLRNEGRPPRGVLLLEDHLPFALGSRPRFVVDDVGARWQRAVSYTVRPEVRGRYEIGPLTVRVGDGFGLVELGRAFRTTTPLVVTPRVLTLPEIGLTGAWSGSGEHRARAFATGSAEDVTVREYRRGDDLRRVHWRSSARAGELMVRREEQPWQALATVLLDDRLLAHRGEGLAGSFETAVVAAASVADHLLAHGYQLVLRTTSGRTAAGRAGREDAGHRQLLLEWLAELAPQPGARIAAGAEIGERPRGLTVAVLGGLLPDDDAALRWWRHQSDSALALVLDVEQWHRPAPGYEPGPGAEQWSRRLTGQGWRAGALGQRDPLATAWQRLGRPSHVVGGPAPEPVR